MSRARVHEVSSPISLFPFIGILLCTMGALLVVLVAVSRDARDSAQREVKTKQATVQADEGTKKKLAYVQKYVGVLDNVRDDAEHKLHDEHQHLSNVEDHIRRLHDKMRSLQAAAVELEGMEREHYDDHAQADRETARLNQLIDESKKSVEKLQEDADKAPTSYAVVPYEGPNGTYRRPMYIECVKDGVILQPEGVRVPAEDLRPPYGAGNPLASVLRAARDQLLRIYPKEAGNRQTEPYPLLLVRADGLVNFDRARQAIEGGDFDLGFELVEDNWKLKFPQADPQLASLEEQALAQARVRQQLLAEAAPQAYKSEEFEADRYAEDDGPGGGSSDGGYGGYGDGGSGVGNGGGNGSSGNGGIGAGGTGAGTGGSGNGGGAFAAGGNGLPGGAGGGGMPGGRGMPGSSGGGGMPGAMGGGASGNAGGGFGGGGGVGGAGGYGGGPGGVAGGNGGGPNGVGGGTGGLGGGAGGDGSIASDGVSMPAVAAVGGASAPSDAIAGAAGGGPGGVGGDSGPGGYGGAPAGMSGGGSPGGMSGGGSAGGMDGGYGGAPSGGMAGGAGAGSAVGSSGAPGGGAGGGGGSPMMASSDPNMPPDANMQQSASVMYGSAPPDASHNVHDDDKHHRSLAETRGKDWALKGKPPRATGVRRTIRVVVTKDQLRILPEGATPTSAGGRVIPMQGDTVQSLDAFVKEVHDDIDSWGMAGTNLYWRPVIVLSVAPQGERRANDLERLLRNSGLELKTDEVANNAARKVQ